MHEKGMAITNIFVLYAKAITDKKTLVLSAVTINHYTYGVFGWTFLFMLFEFQLRMNKMIL